MANFTNINMDCNDGNTSTPSWVQVGPDSGREVRWSDLDTLVNTASASWTAMIRPTSTQIVNYTYAYTADATGQGIYSAGSTAPPVYSKDNYKWGRWNWDANGTFASNLIYTAYINTTHGTVTNNDGSILGGNATDTTNYSYLKANAYGQDDGTGTPSSGPTNAPGVTNGTSGSVSPTAGGNWITGYQGLKEDKDYITAPFTPTATSQDCWSIHFALFTGPNMTPATYTVVMTLKYTWT